MKNITNYYFLLLFITFILIIVISPILCLTPFPKATTTLEDLILTKELPSHNIMQIVFSPGVWNGNGFEELFLQSCDEVHGIGHPGDDPRLS
jgi:hypothetical protein